jgi:hypothetical protein
VVARREKAQKRGGGRVRLESDITASGQFGLDELIGPDMSAGLPQFMSEQCRMLIEALEDPELEKIALGQMDDLKKEEVQKPRRIIYIYKKSSSKKEED